MASRIRRTHKLCNLAYVHRECMIPAGFLRYGFVVFASPSLLSATHIVCWKLFFIPLTQNLKKYIKQAQHRKGLDGTLKMRNFFIATFYFWLKKIFRVWALRRVNRDYMQRLLALIIRKIVQAQTNAAPALCLSNSSHDWTCERQKSRRLFTQF